MSSTKTAAEFCIQSGDPQYHRNEFLARLDLSDCRIPDKGGCEIAKALGSGNLKLQRLNLSRNEIGNRSAAAFGDALVGNHSLLYLDLSWNAINKSGAKDLAIALKKNTSLQHFDLSWNGLETQGVTHFGDMLRCNVGLKFLGLIKTRAGTEACLVLGEGIKVIHTMQN